MIRILACLYFCTNKRRRIKPTHIIFFILTCQIPYMDIFLINSPYIPLVGYSQMACITFRIQTKLYIGCITKKPTTTYFFPTSITYSWSQRSMSIEPYFSTNYLFDIFNIILRILLFKHSEDSTIQHRSIYRHILKIDLSPIA